VSAAAETFWATLPLGRGVTVLEHDRNGVAALAKPAGVLSHPNERGEEPRSLLVAPYRLEGEYFEWTPGDGAAPQRLWLLNRLDSATSGVILAAADGDLAAEIRAQFKRKQVRKIYHALVFGAPRQPMELWRDILAIEKRGGKIRAAASAGNVPAECRMSVVRNGHKTPRVSLLRLEPRTGRSHQLRVQCAKRQLPIVGDQTYGNFAANREFAKIAETKRMFLHSLETSFEYEFRGARHNFAAKAPLPPEFEKFL
jgi:tRNA pseudouridine65 synthase